MRTNELLLPVALALVLSVAPAGAAPEPSIPEELLERLADAVRAGDVGELGAVETELAGASAVQGSWQLPYTLAYIEWRRAQIASDRSRSEQKRLLKSALGRLETLLELHGENAEVLALRGSVIGDRIQGAISGMLLGSKATASLDRALELAPDNPRVALQRAIGFFYTPPAFGGGLEKAEAELRRARELFEAQLRDHPWPDWGRIDVLGWLGKALIEQGKTAEAREVLREALELEPDHVWIRLELLPALGEVPDESATLSAST